MCIDMPPLPQRRLLFDVKTIHAGTQWYTAGGSTRGEAVRRREARVWPDYQRSARLLDARYSPAGTTPIHDRLTSYTPTRGLVFGAYGGASADVHDLVSLAASRVAERQWRLAGARSASEYRSFVVTRMRRRLGMAAAQATARHRLARVPYVGVPRALVVARPPRVARARGRDELDDPRAFYAYQAGGPMLRG